MGNLNKDVNSVAVAGGVSDLDGVTILPFEINHTNGRLMVSAITAGGNTQVFNEVVSGSNTTWTLAFTPSVGTQAIYANGQRLTPTTDYTISGAAITTIDSWAAGTVLADYQH